MSDAASPPAGRSPDAPHGEPQPESAAADPLEPGAAQPDAPEPDSTQPNAPESDVADAERQARRRRWLRRRDAVGRGLLLLLVVVAGGAVGAQLAPSTPAQVGPLEAQVRVAPSLSPGVQLLLPPAGRVDFDTHLAPVVVQAQISEVDLEGARELIASPRALEELQRTAPDQLRAATLRAALTTAVCAIIGSVTLALLVYRRRWSRTAQAAGGTVGLLVLTAGLTAATFDSDSFAQPRFRGLLSQAPYVAGRASSMVRRLESYRSGLADIVQGVTTLYAVSDRLPLVPGDAADDVVTVLHVSDIHLNPLGFDLTDKLVKQFKADMVVDSGDITSWGTEVESGALARVGQVGVPYVFVRGNHDSRRTERAMAANKNVVVLDGNVRVVDGLVFAGIGDPRFTPDTSPAEGPLRTTPVSPPATGTALTTSPPGTPSPPEGAATATPGGPTPTTRTPTLSGASPSSPDTAGTASTSGGTSGSPGAPSRAEEGASPVPPERWAASTDPEIRAGARLAQVIRDWNARRPDQPVAVAVVHEPYAVPPLLGTVPLVLPGHFHTPAVTLDPSGTRVMIEGSTGGAGLNADDLHRITQGAPVPLSATLLYIARRGSRAGQVLAYDAISVGGFGLASISLQRTVIRPDGTPELAPGQVGPPAASPGASLEPAASPEPAASREPASSAVSPSTSSVAPSP